MIKSSPLHPSPFGEGTGVRIIYLSFLLLFCPHELRSGGTALGADAFAFENLRQRHKEDLDIQPESTVIHIPDVELEFLFPRERVAAVHLRPAGDAGAHFVAACLFRRVTLEVLHQQRARTHQAHIAFKHIEEFRQLIQAGGAQEAPEAGEALLVGQQLTIGVAQVAHAAELVEPEEPTMQAWALLAEDHRPAEEEPD